MFSSQPLKKKLDKPSLIFLCKSNFNYFFQIDRGTEKRSNTKCFLASSSPTRFNIYPKGSFLIQKGNKKVLPQARLFSEYKPKYNFRD
jgi:hypothetical protein